MSPLETSVTIVIALVLVALAGYFAWHQRKSMRAAHFDSNLASEHRRYLLRQTTRRFFGSLLLVLLAGLLVGSLFLDYETMQIRVDNEPTEAAKQALRVITFYWMTILLVLMVIVSVAVMDLWATARFGFQQQKQLVLDHQIALEAELARHKYERSE